MSKRLFVVMLFTLFMSGTAFGDSLMWTLQNVVFSDGGTATGWFVFDSATDSVLSYDITVSGGDTATFPAFVYASGAPDNLGGSQFTPQAALDFWTDIIGPLGMDTQRVLVLPVFSLPSDGGTVLFDLTNPKQGECYDCNPYRTFVSGEVTTTPVPEPNCFVLIGAGVGSLFPMLRRKLVHRT